MTEHYSTAYLYIKPDSVATAINSDIGDKDLGMILRRAAGAVIDKLPNSLMETLAVNIRNDCDAYRAATERKNGAKKSAKDRATAAHPSNLPPVHPVNHSADQPTNHPTKTNANIPPVDNTPDEGSNLPAEVDASLLESYGIGELGPSTPPPEVFWDVCERSLGIPQAEWAEQTVAEINLIYKAAILGKGASNTRRSTPIKNWIAYTVSCLISSYEKGSLPQCKSKPRGLKIVKSE